MEEAATFLWASSLGIARVFCFLPMTGVMCMLSNWKRHADVGSDRAPINESCHRVDENSEATNTPRVQIIYN